MKATPEQIAEVEASNGTKTLSFSAQGVQVIERPARSIEKEVHRRVGEKLESALESRAKSRLRRLRERANPQGPAPKAEKILLGEDEELDSWFVREISAGDLREIQFRCPRDSNGVLDVSGGEEWTHFMASTFFVCLATDESGEKLFEQNDEGWREAWEMANETDFELRQINSQLVVAILLKNPDILPEATAEFQQIIGTAQEVGADFLDEPGEDEREMEETMSETNPSEPSSTPPSERPKNSSSEAADTLPPSSSATDFVPISEEPELSSSETIVSSTA